MPRYYKDKIYTEEERARIKEAMQKKILDDENVEFEKMQDIKYVHNKKANVKAAFEMAIKNQFSKDKI